MSEHCEFGQFLEDAVRDKFVCGMINSSMRKRLLTDEDFTLEEVGKMNGFETKVYVKDGAVPKFCRPQKVAFALQKGVNRELKTVRK